MPNFVDLLLLIGTAFGVYECVETVLRIKDYTPPVAPPVVDPPDHPVRPKQCLTPPEGYVLEIDAQSLSILCQDQYDTANGFNYFPVGCTGYPPVPTSWNITEVNGGNCQTFTQQGNAGPYITVHIVTNS